ncbi:MAG: HAD family hydrolase [Actinomycetota bacterium]
MDAVIFDFDGLILDTEWPAFVSVVEVFEAHGAELPLVDWQHRIGRGDNAPWTELLEIAVGRSLDHEELTAQRRERKNAMTDANPIQPGVLDLLGQADRLGMATAVASSSSMSWVGRHLDRLGITDRFGAVRTQDDVERAKPWPDVFLAAASALGVAPGRAVVFEDSRNGVLAAKEAGMFCVAVPNRITEGLDFSDADLVVSSLADIDLAALIAA